jgi:NAD-dependent SIR2 family protein deacetylase
MIYSNTSLQANTAIIKTALEKADLVVVGAGAGLSTSAGIRFNDEAVFAAWFPGYRERYALRTINEAYFTPFPTLEEQYAFWSRFISRSRYQHPAGKPYLDLYRILQNKNHFILTTNTDGQFLKAGFSPEIICTPQGDYAFFQCSRPCNNKIYHNEKMIRTMLSHIGNTDFAIQPEYIPHCPDCGSHLIPNIRTIDNFVEDPWMEKYTGIDNLLNAHWNKRVLFLELGVDNNTPRIIRIPFELRTIHHKNVELIRINQDINTLSLLTKAENAAIIQGEIGAILSKLVFCLIQKA